MLWFMAEYASQEISRLKLGIPIHCLLPTPNPNTDLGRTAVAAYADRAGVSFGEFAKRLAPHLTPSVMGEAVVELFSNLFKWDKLAYQIGRGGIEASKLIIFAEASYVRCYWSNRQYRERSGRGTAG